MKVMVNNRPLVAVVQVSSIGVQEKTGENILANECQRNKQDFTFQVGPISQPVSQTSYYGIHSSEFGIQ